MQREEQTPRREFVFSLRLFVVRFEFDDAKKYTEDTEEEDALVIANIALLFIFIRGRGVCATNACVISYMTFLFSFGFDFFSLLQKKS